MTLAKSPLAFGCYRMSVRSERHREALLYALGQGCDLLDTSANYTDGESEQLIGQILSERKNFTPKVITKGGYIQGQNIALLNQLHSEGKAKDDLVKINEELMHSIHPEFLESQIKGSSQRLQKDKLDYYLLHNPEYYFQEEGSNQEEYYQRIEKAFSYLEEQVHTGKIGAYGISSNNFTHNLDHKEVSDLSKIYEIAKTVSSSHNFKCIQFPLNLVEIGGMENYDGNGSLIEKARAYGITSLINRPLNAFSQNQLLRLATYEAIYPPISQDQAQVAYDNCINLLEAKWNSQQSEESMREVPLFKQIDEIWSTLPSPDAVDQVFMGHFFPFVGRIWGGELTPEESRPFYELYDIALNLSRQQMTIKANQFREQAVQLGLLPDSPETDLASLAIEFYLSLGIDHILLGMRDRRYVEQVQHFFVGQNK